jgi:anti-sigma B factor antagonist
MAESGTKPSRSLVPGRGVGQTVGLTTRGTCATLGPMPLFIDRDGDDGALIVRGEIDLASAASLERAALDTPSDGRLVVDLRDVTFMDSSGIRALVRVSKQVPSQIVIRNPSTRVERLFRMVGLDHDQVWVVEHNDGLRPNDGPGAWSRFAATFDRVSRARDDTRATRARTAERHHAVATATNEHVARSRSRIESTRARAQRSLGLVAASRATLTSADPQ